MSCTLFQSVFQLCCDMLILQEIVSGGGKTVWGEPADVGKIVGGEIFDVVLDNNGKDLESVRFLSLMVFVFNENYLNCLDPN